MLTQVIAFLLTCILQPLVKLVYRPINRILALRTARGVLFYNDYLYDISRFSFRENYSIVFDHLVAPTTFTFGARFSGGLPTTVWPT